MNAPQGKQEKASYLQVLSALGRVVRSEDLGHLGKPTPHLIVEASTSGQWSQAEELVEYYLNYEVRRILSTYCTWICDSLRLVSQRVGLADLSELVVTTLTPWVWRSPDDQSRPDQEALEELSRLVTGGTSHEEDFSLVFLTLAQLIQSQEQAEVINQADMQLQTCLAARDASLTNGALRDVQNAARSLHDNFGDWIWAIATYVQREVGESALEWYYRESTARWMAGRASFTQLASLSPIEHVRLTVEGFRAHLSGPARDGEVAVLDEGDRFVIQADPGGSCERMRRSTRVAAPETFGIVQSAYPWTWNKRGVCTYCVHCAFVNEILPIEQMGVPKRITEYPDDPGMPCRWLIYKDWRAAPAWYFERIGKLHPSA